MKCKVAQGNKLIPLWTMFRLFIFIIIVVVVAAFEMVTGFTITLFINGSSFVVAVVATCSCKRVEWLSRAVCVYVFSFIVYYSTLQCNQFINSQFIINFKFLFFIFAISLKQNDSLSSTTLRNCISKSHITFSNFFF